MVLFQKRSAVHFVCSQIRGRHLVEMLLEGLAPVHAGKGTVVGFRVQQLSVFVAGVVKHPKLHTVCIRVPDGMVQHLCGVRLHPVVRVQKKDILSPGGIQTRVAGSSYTAVGLVNKAKPRILGSSLCAQRGAAVLGAIVDEDGLEVGQSLRPQ